MSAAARDDLATVLERCRAHRAALTRHLTLAPDSLHRVLRCTRCQQWLSLIHISEPTRPY